MGLEIEEATNQNGDYGSREVYPFWVPFLILERGETETHKSDDYSFKEAYPFGG